MQTWKQTFRASNDSILSGAAVSVYLAGTTIAARVFDVNNVLHDTAPQLTTDADGFIELSLMRMTTVLDSYLMSRLLVISYVLA